MSPDQAIPREHKIEKNNTMLFGFWVYIMTDCVLFAALFAVYAVLHSSTYSGPAGYQIFDMPYAFTETLILLTSSFVCGLASLSLEQRRLKKVVFYFAITFLLGLAFVLMELREFHHLAVIGDSFRRSGFLSSYFVLVGTHGLHITIGLLWMAVMMVRIIKSRKLTDNNVRRLKQLALFWHFLDIVWIFIFTIVYLYGALKL